MRFLPRIYTFPAADAVLHNLNLAHCLRNKRRLPLHRPTWSTALMLSPQIAPLSIRKTRRRLFKGVTLGSMGTGDLLGTMWKHRPTSPRAPTLTYESKKTPTA